MNRNSIFGFLVIIGAIWFFQSPFYYHTIWGKRSPQEIAEEKLKVTRQQTQDTKPAMVSPNKPASLSEAPEKGITNIANVPPQTVPVSAISAFTSTDSTYSNADTITIETDKYICKIAEKGGLIASIKTKEYEYIVKGKKVVYTHDSKNFIELLPQNGKGGANLSINGVNYDSQLFFVDAHYKKKQIILSKKDTARVKFTAQNGIQKQFLFNGSTYKIGYSVISGALSGKNVAVGWECGINESEDLGPVGSANFDPKKAHVYDGKNVEHFIAKKVEKEQYTGFYSWTGISSKYFLIALVADTVKDAEITVSSFTEINPYAPPENRGAPIINYGISIKRYSESPTESYWIYAGPTKLDYLTPYSLKFEKVLFSGWKWLLRADLWFPYVAEFVLWLLIQLQHIVKDYGIAIIFITIILKIATYPLTQSSMKSMSRMKDLQPKITDLRKRYSANPKKMNEEIMALYKIEGVNPFNPGCLPMFLQIPVFFALFVVLKKSIEIRGATTSVVPWITDLAQAEALPVITPLFQKILPGGIPMYGTTIGLLPIVMAILTYFQNKMTIKDPNQKMMIYLMPLLFLFMFNSFSSGLVIYWTFQSALGILQQFIIDKQTAARASAVTVGTISKTAPHKR